MGLQKSSQRWFLWWQLCQRAEFDVSCTNTTSRLVLPHCREQHLKRDRASLYPYPPPRLRNNQLWIAPGKCLISTNIQLPLYNDGILTKWRTAKTPRAHVFQGLSSAMLDQIFLLPLDSSSIKERKYSLGNILESPAETASRDVIVAQKRALWEQAAGLPEG